MNNLNIVLYSHSEYSDLWVPALTRLQKHCKYSKIYFVVDKIIDDTISTFNVVPVFYDNNLHYNKRLLSALMQIPEEYVLFLHEDMILYNDVNNDLLKSHIDYMVNNKCDYIRLIKSGVKSNLQIIDGLYKIDSNDITFSITPTVWSKKFLIDICTKTPPTSIWDFEINGEIYLKNKSFNGLYTHNINNQLRGQFHYDSNIFPHMCSAIFKGRWNMEYKLELDELFSEFNIDKTLRGTIF